MSEIKLNLRDAQHTLNGTIHGSIADACVAALSAEPETISELEAALARFIRPVDDSGPFAWFRIAGEIDKQPWDAGIAIIDLAARIVASNSTYSQPGPQGEVHYHDGVCATEIPVLYRLPDDWLFLNSIEEYECLRERRRQERAATPLLDARKVLFGRPLLEWAVSAVYSGVPSAAERGPQPSISAGVQERGPQPSISAGVHERGPQPGVPSGAAPLGWQTGISAGVQEAPGCEITERVALGSEVYRQALQPNSPVSEAAFVWSAGIFTAAAETTVCDPPVSSPNYKTATNRKEVEGSEAESPDPDGALSNQISSLHARWLMTPRDDLQGQSPRDVLLAKQDFIDFDLHTRSLQWSLQGEGPPCLSTDSFAYRFAGFGTHEWVVYYDLVRHLLWSVLPSEHCYPADPMPQKEYLQQLARLEQLKTDWLEQPQEDFGGKIPALIIENERIRLPIAMRGHDMVIDDDCPVCQMMSDDTSLGMEVGFWHLDGSHMDDDFAFSFYKTREEWEAENRRRDEFNKDFNRRWEERQQLIARGEPLSFDPFFDPDPFPGLEFDDKKDLPQ